MKEVHKASKRAKVFETQKIVKRLKDARKKREDEKAGELESELTSLKEVDHSVIGNTALRSRVLKDHTLRENEDIKASMEKELEGKFLTTVDAGTIHAKIQSRLLSSKILSAQITTILDSLKVLLNPALKQPREKITELPKSTTSFNHSMSMSERPTKIRKESNSIDIQANDISEKRVPFSDVDSERQADSGWESGSIDEEGKIDRDDGWESGSIAGIGEAEESEEDASDSDNDELTVTKAKRPQKLAPKGSKGSSTPQSTFLPSLSVGFVRGSDDSDFSDAEGEAADMPKKNRRGQRARRAIWEKKFGRNANHKKKEAEENAGAVMHKRGHTSTNAGPHRNPPPAQGPHGTRPPPKGRSVPQHHQPVDAGWAGRSNNGANTLNTAVTKADKKDDKRLHPSWEAKKRLKEKEGGGIVPSQGTKIKFA